MFDFSTHIPLHSAAFSIHFDCHERSRNSELRSIGGTVTRVQFFLFWQIVTNCSSQIAADRPIPDDETGHASKRTNNSFRRLSPLSLSLLLLLLMYAVRIFVSFSFHFSQNEFIIELIAVRSFVRFCAIDTHKKNWPQSANSSSSSFVSSFNFTRPNNACSDLCVYVVDERTTKHRAQALVSK